MTRARQSGIHRPSDFDDGAGSWEGGLVIWIITYHLSLSLITHHSLLIVIVRRRGFIRMSDSDK